MPIDSLPDSEAETAALYRKIKLPRSILMAFQTKPGVGRNLVPRTLRAMVRPLGKSRALRNAVAKKVSSFGARREYGSTNHVGVLTWGMYGSGERFPISGLRDLVVVEFEGFSFTAMSCWDEYLTGIYGDYMQLPPKGARVNHGMKAWRVESEGW